MSYTGSGAECLMPRRWRYFGKVVETSSKKVVGQCEKTFEGWAWSPCLIFFASCLLQVDTFICSSCCNVLPLHGLKNQCRTIDKFYSHKSKITPWKRSLHIDSLYSTSHFCLNENNFLSFHCVWVTLSDVSWIIITLALEFTVFSDFCFAVCFYVFVLFSSLISSRLMTHARWVYLKSWNIYLFIIKL